MSAALLFAVLVAQAPDVVERWDGPSRMDALMGNGHLTVGASDDGVFTVLRWPTPGFHDHLHHVTARARLDAPHPRDLPRMGASRTDGLFLGVVLDDGRGAQVVRLDDESMRFTNVGYASDTSRLARWTAENDFISITQEALVLADKDVLLIAMNVTPKVPLATLSAFLFAHPAPHSHQMEGLPISDFWNDDSASHDPNGFAALHDADADALIAIAPADGKRDAARRLLVPLTFTAQSSPPRGVLDALDPLTSVAIAFGCDRAAQVQVGSSDQGQGALLPRDALADLADGQLEGSSLAMGDVTLAMLAELPTSGTSDVTFYVALSNKPSTALALLSSTQSIPPSVLREDSERAAAAIVDGVALPDTDEPAARSAALRALIDLEMLTDRDTGGIVASATTQPALGIDRPTDAAIVDVALSHAARLDVAAQHRRLWSTWQRTDFDGAGAKGTFAGGFYTDGVLGSLVASPMDGLALTLWADAMVSERAFTTVELPDPGRPLRQLRESAALALDALTSCVDPMLSLPCKDDEWYRPARVQTVWQAAAAVAAARQGAKMMAAIGDGARERAATSYRAVVAAGLDELLLHPKSPIPLHALTFALGQAGALADRAPERLALLDDALDRMSALLRGEGDGVEAPTIALWQLLTASHGDDEREARARSLLDDYVAGALSPFGHVGLAAVPTRRGGTLRIEQRMGAPNAAAEAALYLALLERHGRRPPPSLPVPDLTGCSCPGGPGGDATSGVGLLALAGMLLTRRVKR